MTVVSFAPAIDHVDSTTAISARAKEIRMQAQRYQRGSLSLLKRKSQPDVWVFRYYAEEGGRRAYKKKIVGTVIEFPKRKDAEKRVAQLREAATYTRHSHCRRVPGPSSGGVLASARHRVAGRKHRSAPGRADRASVEGH